MNETLSAWWPLLLMLAAFVLVFAATAVAGFFAALILAVAALQFAIALGSLVGRRLRHLDVGYPAASETPTR